MQPLIERLPGGGGASLAQCLGSGSTRVSRHRSQVGARRVRGAAPRQFCAIRDIIQNPPSSDPRQMRPL